MARKTIEVGKLLKMTNAFLAAKHTNADEREAVCSMLEAVLFETGNYMGFRYLEGTDYPEEFDGLGSRRYYYPSNAVREDFEAELRDINRIRV
jgi:hypothetical protein